VVSWRRVDLARVIKTRFNVTLAEGSVGAMLRRSGFGACRCGRAIRSRTRQRGRHTKNFALTPEGRPVETLIAEERKRSIPMQPADREALRYCRNRVKRFEIRTE
jgi:Winged helix-turn helix